MAGWGQRIADRLDSPEKLERSRYAFMPAALEIQETLPSPIGRAIIWVIVLFFVIAVTWAIVGKMDVVAVAHGKIIPSGRVKTIQPLEIGTVKEIHIHEGQSVTAGEPLISLDSTATQADLSRFEQQLVLAQLQQRRQQHFHHLLGALPLPADWQTQARELLDAQPQKNIVFGRVGVPNTISTDQYQLLIEQVNEFQYGRNTLENELATRQAEQRGIRATQTKLARTLPLITARTESLKTLFNSNMIGRDLYYKLEQERIENEQDLIALKAQHQELDAAISEIRSRLQTLTAETQKNNLRERNDSNANIAGLQQELIKAQQRNQQRIIKAPITGTVQQLAVHTIGGVVTPAQELMLIVPTHSVLEVEALILNKDIGFVEEGQQAEVKIDTFNFTKYGTIDAHITSLSNDAISDENLGLVYMAKVHIQQTQMEINNKLVNLSPGMSVTVEIKTDKRRIIEYFLSPLLRYRQESIRER